MNCQPGRVGCKIQTVSLGPPLTNRFGSKSLALQIAESTSDSLALGPHPTQNPMLSLFKSAAIPIPTSTGTVPLWEKNLNYIKRPRLRKNTAPTSSNNGTEAIMDAHIISPALVTSFSHSNPWPRYCIPLVIILQNNMVPWLGNQR